MLGRGNMYKGIKVVKTAHTCSGDKRRTNVSEAEDAWGRSSREG